MVSNTRDLSHVESDYNDNLIINFSQLLGYECIVKITPWHQGISWSGASEAEPQTIAELTEMGMPFAAICGEEGATSWLATFPEGLQKRLVEYEFKYRGTVYALLWCISRSTYARELFESNPLLVWLLLKTAQAEQWDTHYVLNLFSYKRTKIFLACRLSESKAALKLITKVKFSHFSQREFEVIKAYDWRDASKSLSHLPFLDNRLLKFLQHYPYMKASKLIQNFRSEWNWREFNMIFKDTLNMADNLGIRDIIFRISLCKDINQLTNLHDKLAVEINEQNCKEVPLLEYKKPPVEGTQLIVPIMNNHDLYEEGKTQHHCIASYHARIFHGEYYVYKILEPERATLGIKLIRGGGYSIDQIYLKYNGIVSTATRESVIAWFHDSIIE